MFAIIVKSYFEIQSLVKFHPIDSTMPSKGQLLVYSNFIINRKTFPLTLFVTTRETISGVLTRVRDFNENSIFRGFVLSLGL